MEVKEKEKEKDESTTRVLEVTHHGNAATSTTSGKKMSFAMKVKSVLPRGLDVDSGSLDDWASRAKTDSFMGLFGSDGVGSRKPSTHRKGPNDSRKASVPEYDGSLEVPGSVPVPKKRLMRTGRSTLLSSSGGSGSSGGEEEDGWIIVEHEDGQGKEESDKPVEEDILPSGRRKSRKKTRSELRKERQLLSPRSKSGTMPKRKQGRKITRDSSGFESEILRAWSDVFPDQSEDRIIAGIDIALFMMTKTHALIAAYSCILARSVDRKGTIFTSMSKIYFYSTKYHTKVIIPWEEVASLLIEKTTIDSEDRGAHTENAVRLGSIHDEEVP